MAEVKLRALGLREVDFGDFDRYLTALTEDGRRIEILCKNARRGKKQNPAARQLCYSEFILSDRGGRYTLRDADLVHSFFALHCDPSVDVGAVGGQAGVGHARALRLRSPSRRITLSRPDRKMSRFSLSSAVPRAGQATRT